MENPIVIYVMRTPDEIGVPLTDTHKASAAGNITFRTDDAMLRDLQARDNIRCEIIPIGETVQREFDSVKRICGALALICAVFIALNVFVSGFFAIILNESSGQAVSAAVSLRGRSAKCAPFRRSRRCLRFLRQYCSKCEIAPQVQLNHKQKDADVSASFCDS